MGRWMIRMILGMRGCLACSTRGAGGVREDVIKGIEVFEKGLEVLRPWLVPELMRRSFFQLSCHSKVK